AARLLASDERTQPSICGRCTWLFLDPSPTRRRRWCSMAICGNRAKAQRHQRQWATLPPPSRPNDDVLICLPGGVMSLVMAALQVGKPCGVAVHIRLSRPEGQRQQGRFLMVRRRGGCDADDSCPDLSPRRSCGQQSCTVVVSDGDTDETCLAWRAKP